MSVVRWWSICEFTVGIVSILWADFEIFSQDDVQVLEVGHTKPVWKE